MTEDLRRIEGKINWLTVAVICLFVIVGWLFIDRVQGQEIGKWVPTPAEAVGWALGDLAAVGEADRPFQRYVWLPPWADERWIAAVNFSVNTAASHSAVIQLATPCANGWLMRYDMRRLAPSIEQLQKLLTTWDGLALQDPYFHVPLINSKVPAAVLAPHLRQQEAVALAGLSLSTGAIYRADFLLVKMLSTLEGGKYYDFLQVPRKVAANTNPQSAWLSTLGVFEATTKSLAADQRTAIFRSGVTGKPRRIDVFYGLGRGGNLVTITHDIGDEDVDAGQHPIRNLLAFDDRGREAIVSRPNGTHAFALFDDSGNFVDSVPDNIATDHTVPAPHTKRLQSAISCIRCHGPHDGYQPFGNDVQTILRSRLDVFSDLAGNGVTREQVVDRLAGLYAGQLDVPDGPIGRGRRDYSAAVYRIVGGAYGDAPSVVTAASDHVSGIFANYRYDVVSPQRACMELGLSVEPNQGIAGLEKMMGNEIGVAIDPISGTLRAGIAVNRSDFEHVYADLALTASRNRKVPQQ
jgi:hypothetical protein